MCLTVDTKFFSVTQCIFIRESQKWAHFCSLMFYLGVITKKPSNLWWAAVTAFELRSICFLDFLVNRRNSLSVQNLKLLVICVFTAVELWINNCLDLQMIDRYTNFQKFKKYMEKTHWKAWDKLSSKIDKLSSITYRSIGTFNSA